MKGHTKIKLTNTKTGQVDVYESDNEFTPALDYIYKGTASGHCYDPANILGTTGWTNFTGGLVAFDTTLDTDCIFPPASATAVAYGTYNYTDDPGNGLRGIYNTSSSDVGLGSEALDDYGNGSSTRYSATYEYTFTEDEAIGTIASVCLTSTTNGLVGYGGSTVTSNTSETEGIGLGGSYPKYSGIGNMTMVGTETGDEVIYLLDDENDTVNCVRIDSTSSITFIQRRAWLQNANLFRTMSSSTNTLMSEQSVDLETSIASASRVWANYDTDNNYIYIISVAASSSTASTSATISVHRFTYDTTTHTVDTSSVQAWSFTNPTGSSLYAYASYHLFFVYDDTLYANSSSYYYAIELGDNITSTAIEPSKSDLNMYGNNTAFISASNGRIYVQGGGSAVISDNDGTYTVGRRENAYLFSGTSTLAVPVLSNPCIMMTNDSDYRFYLHPCYLATVNNLEEAIEKTSEQTMTITYTITEE